MGMDQEIYSWLRRLDDQVRQLEKHIHYPHNETAMKEAAARAQALDASMKQTIAQANKKFSDNSAASMEKAQTANNVPMRTDVEAILTMAAFCKRLLDTHDLAYAVTLEVRNEARRALGLKEREV